MKPQDYQIKRFGEMIDEFGKKHHLYTRHGKDCENPNDVYRIRFENNFAIREYVVVWSDVKSLTDAATPIFVNACIELRLLENDKNDVAQYCAADVAATQALYDQMHPFEPVKVIFNCPATIVFWRDGSKTVVKAQPGEEFDEMMGLAMAISKKALGNKGNYNEVFKKWVPNYGKQESTEFVMPQTFANPFITPMPFESANFKKAMEDMIDRMLDKRARGENA